jgi:hypothetical protein
MVHHTQVNEIVCWLKEEQKALQERFNKKIKRNEDYSSSDFRGVWIIIRCRCGHEFNTPFFISFNGVCPECHKQVFRKK